MNRPAFRGGSISSLGHCHCCASVMPGHGTVGDRAFAVRSMTELRTIAELATLVHKGVLELNEAVLRTPYPADTAMEPLTRAAAQLRGELD